MSFKFNHLQNESLSEDKSIFSQSLEGEPAGASSLAHNPKCYKTFDSPISNSGKDLLPHSHQRFDDSCEPKVDNLQHGVGQFKRVRLWTQIVGTLGTSSIYLMFSVMLSFSGITLPQMTDRNSSDIFLDNDQASLFSSINNLGNLFGSLLAGPLMVIFGHRFIILFCVPGSMVGWIVLSQTSNYGTLIAIRVIHGIIIGVAMPCTTNYLIEISHSSIRGRLIGIRGIIGQVGVIFLYSVGGSGLSWRNVALICGLMPAMIPFLIFLFLPNSPRWLGTKGRFQEAHSSLTFFRGKGYNVALELEEIKEDILKKGRSKSVFDQLRILRERSIIKRLMIVSLITSMTGFLGNMTILSYSTTIFQLADTGFNEYLSSIVSITTRAVGCCVFVSLIDKYGRKPLLSISIFLSGLCMLCFALYFYLQTVYDDWSSISWIPLTTLLLYNLFITIYLSTILMLEGALLPNSVRAITSGMLSVLNNLSIFLGILTFQPLIDGVGPQWTFFLYGAVCILASILTAFTIPETKGKSLEEIEKLFN